MSCNICHYVISGDPPRSSCFCDTRLTHGAVSPGPDFLKKFTGTKKYAVGYCMPSQYTCISIMFKSVCSEVLHDISGRVCL